MERYQRGKIYRIVCRKTSKQYFGSTCKKLLSQRLACHICAFKKWINKGMVNFMTSFEVLREDDYYIELVELVPCSSNDELKVRERFHIQNNECVNKNIPLRTIKEYYEANKEQIAEYQKEYKQSNKEQIAEYKKEYQQANKEQIAEKNKEYKQTHKEQIAEYHKEYAQINKEKISEKTKETFTCICGTISTIKNKTRHEKSIKHQNYLKNIASKSLGEICCVIENGENIQVK